MFAKVEMQIVNLMLRLQSTTEFCLKYLKLWIHLNAYVNANK